MSLRPSLARGAVLAAFVALGSAFFVPASRAEEKPKDVRLLVSCDAGSRPKVLEALRGLDVTVHDLSTMERVPTGAAAAPVADALRVFSEVMGVVESVRKAAGTDQTIAVMKVEVGSKDTQLAVRVSHLDLLDSLSSALRANASLGAPRPVRGPVTGDAKAAAYFVTIAFPTPPAPRMPDVVRGSEEAPAVSALVQAVRRTRGTVEYVSAVEVVLTPTEEIRSHTMKIDVADLAAVEAILREMAATPGTLISQISAAVPKGGPMRVTVQVTVRVPR